MYQREDYIYAPQAKVEGSSMLGGTVNPDLPREVKDIATTASAQRGPPLAPTPLVT